MQMMFLGFVKSSLSNACHCQLISLWHLVYVFQLENSEASVFMELCILITLKCYEKSHLSSLGN
jgi:hypothetical protein